MTRQVDTMGVLEDLLEEPFMAITAGSPIYEIESKPGISDYAQVIARLQVRNVRPDVMNLFRKDYNILADHFDKWTLTQNFTSSQILEGDDSTLIFEITAVI